MKIIICVLVLSIFLVTTDSYDDLNSDIKRDTRILSRKRRFLQFPSGSSFQLVFCLTYTSIVNTYFVFGHTAALAWELPSMPLFFDGRDFQKKEEETTTGAPTTTELTVDIMPELENNNKNIDRFSSYNRVNHIQESYRNPFYDYVNEPEWFNSYRKPSYFASESRTKQIYKQNKYNDFQRYSGNDVSHMMLKVDPEYHQVYRRTRRELYNKLQHILARINLDGKACLLKAICEVTKYGNEKDTLLVEIFKAVLRVKPQKDHNKDEYDLSANDSHNCENMYPTCQGSIRNVNLLVRK